jgi:hypothetical protein
MLANIVLHNLIKESWVKSRAFRELYQVLPIHKLNILDEAKCVFKEQQHY